MTEYPLELTVLMPCLNEVETLATCIAKAKAYILKAEIKGEVVISDNGSTDGSQALARSLGARVIDVPVRGYGAALGAGIAAAKGRYIIMGDSDDSYDFSALDLYMQELRNGCELVMGNRFMGGIKPGAMPALHRYLGNPVLSGIGRLFFTSPIRDFHCGLRGFQRDSIANLGLKTLGMEFASEMVVKATLHKLKVTEVPTVLSPDGRGRSPHLRSWRDGWRHLRFLLVHAPAWLFMWPGVLLLLIGILGVTMIGIAPLHIQNVVFDIHSMLYASAAGTLGFQMVLLAGLSSFHAYQTGVLPDLPHGMNWVRHVTLERGLIAGLVVVLVGLLLAVFGVLLWASAGFSEVEPRSVMRIAIPSCMLMVIGGEAMLASFMFEVLKLHR